MSVVRVLLVDAHTLFREGLMLLLATRADTLVAGEALSSQTAYQKADELLPDLFLVDESIPDDPIIEVLSKLKGIRQSAKIIVLTEKNDESLIRASLKAGADGFVPKTSAFEELDFAIKTTLAGHYFLSPSISDLVVKAYLSYDGAIEGILGRNFSSLSLQEEKVFNLFCREMPPEAIASELGISRKTVDIHKRNIKRKLGVDSDIGLIKLAMGQKTPTGSHIDASP